MRSLHCCLRMLNLTLLGLAFTPLPAAAQESVEPVEPAVASAPEPTVAVLPALVEPPPPPIVNTIEGKVSYYGAEFAGRRTANGERFMPSALTMAHKSLSFGTWVRVTNLLNNLSVVVRVNDRGPFVGGRVGDLSLAAARLLGALHLGVVPARLEVLGLQAPAKE